MSVLPTPVRIIKRRLRKFRRSPIAIVAFLVFAAGAGLVFSLWMKPGDLTLQQAKLALANRKPQLALRMIEPVLQKEPHHLPALCIQAEAQLALHEFMQAQETLRRATQDHPHALVVRELLVRWTFEHARYAMQQPEFSTSDALQKTFDELLEVGHAQARWFLDQPGAALAVKSRFIQACLVDLNIRRYRAVQESPSRQIPRSLNQSAQLVSFSPHESKDNFHERIDALSYELEGHLKAVTQLAPNHFNAWMMYIDYLSQHNDTLPIWESAVTLSKRHDLPASLVARIVTSLLTEMDTSMPQERIVEMGFQLLSAVQPGDRSTVDYKLAAARLHLLNGDQPEALKLLDQVVESNPKEIRACYLLAKTLFEQENYWKAKNILQTFEHTAALTSQFSLLYGLTLMKTKEHEKAAEVLQRAMHIDPDHSALRATFLTLMLAEGKLHKYENEVRDYYTDNSSSLLAIRLMLNIEQSTGNVEQVLSLIDRVESIQPLTDDHRLLVLDGLLYLKDHQRAVEYAQALIRRRPSAVEGYLGLSAAYLQQGQYGKAYEELQLIEKRFPFDPRIQELQGRCMVQEGRYDRAAALFQSIVNTQPNNLDVRVYLAECLLNMGLVGESTELVEGVLKKNPQHMSAHRLAVRAFTRSGQTDVAAKYLSQLREDQVAADRYPLLLAKMKYQKGDVDGASAVCERAVVGGNVDPELRYYFANLLISQQNHSQAEFYLRKLVSDRPHDPQAFSLLTSFYLQHQSPEKSMEKLRALESLDPSLAQISQAMVLKSSQRIDEARSLLSNVLDTLIDQQSENAMIVADELAAIESNLQGSEAALDIYDRLVRANWMVSQAVLKQMEISTECHTADLNTDPQARYALAVQPEKPDMRFAYMRQYVAQGDYESALELLDGWIEDHPRQFSLRRARAELLVEADRKEEAIQEYRRILDEEPMGATTWLRASNLLAHQYRFPEALTALMSMADIDENATSLSLAQQSLLFNQVGLTGRSATVLDQLAAQAVPRDPSVLLMLGETSFEQNNYKQSRRYLSQIPILAPHYVRAQLTLARLDQYEGQTDRARSRVVSLANNPRTVASFVVNVLTYNMRDANEFQIVQWCDEALPRKLVYAKKDYSVDSKVDSLSDDLKQSWLKIRITLADHNQRWADALHALDQLADLLDESPRIDLARFCLATHVKQLKQSRDLYTSLIRSQSEHVRLLLALVMDPQADHAQVAKMIQSDLWTMPSLCPAGWTTVFSSDVRDTDLSGMQYTDRIQSIAASYLTREALLPGLSGAISKKILEDHPEDILAGAMYAQSLLDQDETDTLSEYAKTLHRIIPAGSLTLYLSALEKSKSADDEGAIKDLMLLLEREPNHARVKYILTQAMVRTDRHDEAISLLESLYKNTSLLAHSDEAMTAAIANDLAYLLVTHDPDRIEEAYAIAQQALTLNPQHRSLLDTIGWIEHVRGRDELAIYHLSQAITMRKPSPDVHYHIGAVYHALGQDEWAGYHLTEAVRSATESTQSAGRRARDLLQKLESKG